MQVPTQPSKTKVKRAKRTNKRTDLIKSITKTMLDHELFGGVTSRKSDSEYNIQKAVFLRLNSAISKILQEEYGMRKSLADEVPSSYFKFEQNTKTTVNNFSLFSTGHRPDGVLEIPNEDLRIAIEIKKGDSGGAIRSGIGQAVVYSYEFDFVIYFFVDTTPGNNIKSSATGVKEDDLIQSLWDNYNVKLVIV